MVAERPWGSGGILAWSRPAPGYPGFVEQQPVLAVDVDGVISLFGFDGPLEDVPGRFHLIDGIAHCIADGAGPRLLRLAEHYELVWATGWEERANDHLPPPLGLPADLPVLTSVRRARLCSAHPTPPA